MILKLFRAPRLQRVQLAICLQQVGVIVWCRPSKNEPSCFHIHVRILIDHDRKIVAIAARREAVLIRALLMARLQCLY
ncbi:hypothetical protein APHAL10511_000874 [Amanita phalloides]|nr:hypothetical protein APHAL10511_000874 [Amanita phalloides]